MFLYIWLRFKYEQLKNSGLLGAQRGWYPIPYWLHRILAQYPMSKRVLTYARLCVGTKVHDSSVSKELACANSVTGILEMVDPSFFGKISRVDRINGTYTLSSELSRNRRFKKRDRKSIYPGDIIVNATGKGKPGKRGHTGIVNSDLRIMSNVSRTGKWQVTHTWDEWRHYYEGTQGIPTEIYKIIK